MATYLSNITDYIPQIQPFAPNLNLYANVLQTKQSKYDSNWKSLNNVYSQYFYADLTREDNQERRDDLMKAIDFNLKKVSGLDLSLEQNVRQAKQLFTPFYEDKYLMRDMAYTKNYQQEMNRAMSAKNCVGKDCEGTYWNGGVELLNYQLDKFKKANLEESLSIAAPSYVPYFDLMQEANELVKKYNYEIVVDSTQGGYMVREKNGPNAVGSLNDFILQNFMNNPKALDFYKAQAQLDYYKNPDKIYEKYQSLMNPAADPTKPADPAVRAQIQDEENENVLNETKLLFSTLSNKTDDEIKNLEYNKLLLEKRQEMFGSNWNLTDEAKELEAINTNLENKKRLQSEIDPLNNQIQSVQYKDKDGKSLTEEELVNTVAMGFLMSGALNTAKTIAMNKYSRTVTGVDPYAMANYKAKMKAIYSGGGSSGKKSTRSSNDEEPEEITEQITQVEKNVKNYVKSDTGKKEVEKFKKEGYSENDAKIKVELNKLKEQKDEMKKRSNPPSKEMEDKLDNKIRQKETDIKNAINEDFMETNISTNVSLFTMIAAGETQYTFSGKDGVPRTKKVNYQEQRTIVENQLDFLTSIPKAAIAATKQSKLDKQQSFTNNHFSKSAGTNNHQNKAVNDYIKKYNLKPKNQEIAEFVSDVYNSSDFQDYLFKPLFNIKDKYVGLDKEVIKETKNKLKQESQNKTNSFFGKLSTAFKIIKDDTDLAAVYEPDKQKAAYLESLKSMGFTNQELTQLVVDQVALDQQLERMYRFNEQNKNSLILTGIQWLKENNYSKNKFSFKEFLQIVPAAGRDGLPEYNITDNFKKWIFMRNPFVQNNEGVVVINDQYNPVRKLITDFIPNGVVDEDLKKIINLYSKNSFTNPPFNKSGFSNANFVSPSMEFTKKQKESLEKAGYWKNGKILNFFNDIIPDENTMSEMNIEMIKGLNSHGSKGNIFSLNPNASDWQTSATAIASKPTPITEVKYLPKLNNIISWISKYITGNETAFPSDLKKGQKVSDKTFVPLYIDGISQSFEKTDDNMVLIKDILFKNKDLKELFEIKAEFQTHSPYSNHFSTSKVTIIPTGKYNDKGNKEIRDTYQHLVNKEITFYFPTQIDEDLQQIKQKDYLSIVSPDTEYKSLDNYTKLTLNGVENGNLLINVSDIYFKNNEKKINTFQRSIPVASNSNWNEFIVNMLLDYSAKRNY